MQTLVKIGVSLTVVAAVLVGACYNVLLAQGVSHPPISAAERVIATETRPLGAGIVNIDLNGPVDLKLVQGNSPSMTVRAEKKDCCLKSPPNRMATPCISALKVSISTPVGRCRSNSRCLRCSN
ncbi:hypothetical protein ACFS07_23900 [Undibacterium arcticum]